MFHYNLNLCLVDGDEIERLFNVFIGFLYTFFCKVHIKELCLVFYDCLFLSEKGTLTMGAGDKQSVEILGTT